MRGRGGVAGAVIAAVAGMACSVGAQSGGGAQSQPQMVLHAQANTVVVDVVVTQNGKPVTGIDRKRFHIYDDNHEQTVTFAEEHSPATVAAAPKFKPLPPHFYTNVPLQPAGSAINVLLLDGLNTPMGNQMDVRRQMVKYLASIKPGTMMAVFTLSSRLRMVQGFTSDSTALVNALKGAKTNPYQSPQLGGVTNSGFNAMLGVAALMGAGQPDMNSVQEFQDDVSSYQDDRRIQMTMAAMQQLARYLSAVPGRKNLMWFSNTFPIDLGAGSSMASNVTGSYAAQMRDTAALLAAARVAVYPMDAQGIATPAAFDVGNDGLDGHVRESGLDNRFTEETIAKDTGGQAIFNTNDFSNAVATIIDNGSRYYTIAYTPDAKKFHGEFRKIKVRIDDCNCELAYRSGYYAEPPGKSVLPQTNAMITATLHGAPPSTQVLFQSRVLPATDPMVRDAKLPATPLGEMAATLKQPTRRFIADMVVDAHTIVFGEAKDGSHVLALEFALVAYDADGKRVNSMDRNLKADLPAAQYAQIMSGGVPVRMAIDVPSAPTYLVLAVHDLVSARVGSIEVPLPK